MAFLTFSDSGINPVRDEATLSAIFTVAANAYEAQLAYNRACSLERGVVMDSAYLESEKRTRTVFERSFARLIENTKILSLLPELGGEPLSRVLGIALIEGAYRTAMYNNTAPLETLDQMKIATAQSPLKSFYHAAIDELAGDYTGKPWPERSVADTEHQTLNAFFLINRSRYLLDRAEFLFPGRTDIHPKELESRQRTIDSAQALPEDKIPETLYLMAQKYAKRLRELNPQP
jgi:hypothetical protein